MKKILPLLAFFFSFTAQAADTYKLDPANTSIVWTSDHYGFSSPTGKFTQSEGVLTLDEVSPQNSSVEISINTNSVMSGSTQLDDVIKGKDFLDATKFPTAKFVSTSVILKNRTSAKITGNLTLLGITKPVILNVKLNKIGANPITNIKTVGFSANTTIKRSDFGMNFGIPGINDQVKLFIESEGILLDSNTTNATQITPKNNGKPQSLKLPLKTNEWKLLPEKSSVNFVASQKDSTIRGSFKKIDGQIIFDKDAQKGNSLIIVIDTSSIDVSYSEALLALKSQSWLAISSFPQATFKANQFNRLSDKSFIANGTLTIKGKSIPTNVTFNLAEYSKVSAVAVGTFIIKRSNFNIGNKDPKLSSGIDENVEISFKISGERTSTEVDPNSLIPSTLNTKPSPKNLLDIQPKSSANFQSEK